MRFSKLIVICFQKIELTLKVFVQNNWINVQYKSDLKKSLFTVLKFYIKTYKGYYCKQNKLSINCVSGHNYSINLVSQVLEKKKKKRIKDLQFARHRYKSSSKSSKICIFRYDPQVVKKMTIVISFPGAFSKSYFRP